MLDLREPDRAILADLGRTTLRLWEWGDPADRPVLLVHGGWDHGRMWDGFAPRLAQHGYRVVAVDVRGHGDSSRLNASGTYWDMFVLDLALLCRWLGAPVRVVGHSFGGGLSLSLTSVFPALVDRVVNIDGMGPPPEMFMVQDHAATASQWLADAERIWFEPQREYPAVEAMAAKRKEINVRLPMEWCLHLARHGTVPGPGGGWVWKSDPSFRLGSPNPFDEAHLLAGYRRIDRPLLVVIGDQPDTWSGLSPGVLDARLGCIDGARLAVVPGAGHYVHIEQPDAAAAEVVAFFAGENP